MWSGLLPPGMRESDLSDLSEEEGEEPGQCEKPLDRGVHESCYNKFLDLQKRRSELTAQSNEKQKRRRHRNRKGKNIKNPEESTSSSLGSIKPLDTLQPYFGINDRLEPPVCQKVVKKSRLEQSVDEAVHRGDIEVAEELSDRLATRELAVKITKASSYRKHLKAKEEEEENPLEIRKKKKKNLPWGFEAKQRWETKSNMGYM
ncbi:hypothetical protein GDO86_013689 [Hymenochirus boettgeri]|uniref:Family with sequence similarity 204 member A n=1 Tax=Hymenochirus boettgeri TaxID=247094 RepID=A0A8T2ISC7_9PIPI|nr:hypothetical protein GDO86_013689 [Hymenochirus boettgeri]